MTGPTDPYQQLPRFEPTHDQGTPAQNRGSRMWLGALIALGGHAVTIGIGFLLANGELSADLLSVTLLGQLLLAVLVLVVGIAGISKKDGGLGLGLIIGWAVGLIICPVVGFGVCVTAMRA